MLSNDRLDDIALLEDLSMTAWPAPRRLVHCGWGVYFADGHTGRANSANALVPLTQVDDATIEVVEAAYRHQGLPAMFRLTPLCPDSLGDRLRARGYNVASESHVMRVSLPAVSADVKFNTEVQILTRLEPSWLAAYRAMVPVPEAEMPALMAILSGIAVPTRYALLIQEGEPVAACLMVLDRGWAGFFKVACRPDHRGQGLTRRLLTDLMARAAADGAGGGYLQVGVDNAPAIALYRRLGFQPFYRYAYAKRG